MERQPLTPIAKSPNRQITKSVRPGRRTLPLHPAQRQPADELLLRDEEENDAGQHGHDARGHEVVRLAEVAVLVLEGIQRDGQRHVLLGLQINERAEEVVPRGDEGEDGGDGDDRLADGQHDLPPDAEVAAAIHAGGLDEGLGHLGEELTEHEDEKGRAEEGGDDERQVRIDPAKGAEHDEHGDHRDLGGEHHRGDHDDEERAAAAEAQAGEGVADEGAGEDLADNGQCCDDDRVGEGVEEAVPGATAHAGERGGVILELRVGGKPVEGAGGTRGGGFGGGGEAGGEHPPEGEHHCHGAEYENQEGAKGPRGRGAEGRRDSLLRMLGIG